MVRYCEIIGRFMIKNESSAEYVSFDIGYEDKIYSVYYQYTLKVIYLLNQLLRTKEILTYKHNKLMQISTAIVVIPSLLDH